MSFKLNSGDPVSRYTPKVVKIIPSVLPIVSFSFKNIRAKITKTIGGIWTAKAQTDASSPLRAMVSTPIPEHTKKNETLNNFINSPGLGILRKKTQILQVIISLSSIENNGEVSITIAFCNGNAIEQTDE